MNIAELVPISQVLFLVDLGILAILDYKYKFTFTLLLAPMWAAAVIAAIPLIGAALFTYAVELAVITIVLMLFGILRRSEIGDGDIWILICAVWVFAEVPIVLVFTFIGSFVLARYWAKRAKPLKIKIKGIEKEVHAAPFATCMGIVMAVVIPVMLYLNVLVL